MNERWYDKTVAQVEEKLNTDINTGLSPSILRSRQKNDEMNVIYPLKHYSFESCVKKIVYEPTTLLLALVALMAGVLEQNRAAWIVLVLLAFYVIISVFTYNKARKIFEDMTKLSLPTTKVMRNGKMFLIKSEQLVKGDVIYLSSGDMVPADARVVECDNLQVLEVNLTGAIKPTEKDPLFLRYSHDVPPSQQENMVFASTIVIKGTAKAICCCTGKDTLVRKLEKSKPLVSYKNIKAISFMSGYSKIWALVLICVLLSSVILSLAFGAESTTFLDIFLTSLALTVASTGVFHSISSYIIVANGLFSAVKQNKHINSGALIKNISKIEQLKNITCLLVNKEGAFSIRDVRAEKVFVNNSLYTDGEVNFAKNAKRVLRFALISTGIYGAGNIIKNNLNNENIYSAEEDAIIALSQKCNVYNIKLDKRFPILEHVSKSESSRFETTLVNSGEGYTVACRGTLDSILAVCTNYAENGKVYPFDAERKAEIVSEALRLGRDSYKIVAVASKNTHYNTLRRIISCQTDMTFEGFIAIKERVLPGAAKNIADCQAAGIKVIMLCDDVGDNNQSVATALGIVKSGEEIVTGNQLNLMRDELFRTNISLYKLYEGIDIFQKRKLLSYLHEEGEVVGVLSRELEEIILLKEADVGFLQSTTLSGKLDKAGLDMAMAKNTNSPMLIKKSKDSKKTGSEALKFIADVIVSDADKRGNGGFNAMINSIVASKMIYKNLLEFVKYLLTINVARFCIIGYAIFSKTNLLIPQQLLFSGLIVDFFAMIIISFERPSNRAVLLKNTTEELLNIHNYIPHSILKGILCAVTVMLIPILLTNIDFVSETVLSTAVFIGIIFSQIAVLSETIKDESIFKQTKFNRAHFLFTFLTLAFTIVSLLFEPIGVMFGVVKLNWWQFLIALIPTFTMIFVSEIQKLFSNIKPPRNTE